MTKTNKKNSLEKLQTPNRVIWQCIKSPFLKFFEGKGLCILVEEKNYWEIVPFDDGKSDTQVVTDLINENDNVREYCDDDKSIMKQVGSAPFSRGLIDWARLNDSDIPNNFHSLLITFTNLILYLPSLSKHPFTKNLDYFNYVETSHPLKKRNLKLSF